MGVKLNSDYSELGWLISKLSKSFRLERQSLLRQAQLNAPLMTIAKKFPNVAGAALRQRNMKNVPMDSSPKAMRWDRL